MIEVTRCVYVDEATSREVFHIRAKEIEVEIDGISEELIRLMKNSIPSEAQCMEVLEAILDRTVEKLRNRKVEL